MKARAIIDFETDDLVAQMDVSGEVADELARVELADTKITRLVIMRNDEIKGEIIPAEQCGCQL